MSAREDILARVRRGQAGGPVPVPRDYRPAGTQPVDIELFIDRLVDYKATVRRCGPADIAATVRAFLDGAFLDGAFPEGGFLEEPVSVVRPDGLPAEWIAGFTLREDQPPLSTDELDATAAVVTTCALAVAETGTIILDHGPGQGRRALSLVPDHHVVIVRADQVVASIPDAVAALSAGTVQTWISGPSATSDIELSRVEGVHGPRRLGVIIVD